MSNPPIPFFVHGRLPESSPGDDPYFFAHSAATSLLANVQLVLGVVNALSKEPVPMPLLADQLKRDLVNLDGNVQWLWRALKPATSEFTATADERQGALRLCDQSGPNVHDIVGKVGSEVFGKSIFVGLRGPNRISNVLSVDDLDQVRKALSEFDPKEIDVLCAECDREYQLTCRRLDIPVRDFQAEATGLWSPEPPTVTGLDERQSDADETGKANRAGADEVSAGDFSDKAAGCTPPHAETQGQFLDDEPDNSKSGSVKHRDSCDSAGDDENELPPLLDKDMAILTYLAQIHPLCATQAIISAGDDCPSEKVLRKRLDILRTAGLIHRPAGERRGEQITDKGRRLISGKSSE